MNWYFVIHCIIGADIIGVNCRFGPNETLQTICLMKDALEKAELKVHLMVQPVCYHTPDAGPTGWINLPEVPLGKSIAGHVIHLF